MRAGARTYGRHGREPLDDDRRDAPRTVAANRAALVRLPSRLGGELALSSTAAKANPVCPRMVRGSHAPILTLSASAFSTLYSREGLGQCFVAHALEAIALAVVVFDGKCFGM